MKVPTGQYTLRVVDEEDVTYATAEFSYEDPRIHRVRGVRPGAVYSSGSSVCRKE